MDYQIYIDGKPISENNPPFIIAEMSANHNGSIERAFATIESAAKCGVDAIKMQTYTADTMTIDCDKEDFVLRGGLWNGYKLYDLYKWAETPFSWHKEIFAYAKKLGITIFSTPFDESAVDLLESLNNPAYKIASFEILDLPLLKYVASTNKPIIISTGMASEEEISEALETILHEGNNQICLLHCISSYPAPIEESNLIQIKNLKEKYGLLTGLSDHTMGITAAITSVGLGACLIEKHFTLSRKDKGPDSDFSLEPNEFRNLCIEAKNSWKAIGSKNFMKNDRSMLEKSNRDLRRSIYFIKDKKAGEIIESSDLKRIRPGKGLPPKYLDKLIGLKLSHDVSRGDPTRWDLFEKEYKN